MSRLFALLAVAGIVSVAVPETAEAGLFCRAKKSCCEPVCCEPAPTCCAPAPTCCAPAPVCCPEPVCCPDPCCKPKKKCLLGRLFSRKKNKCCEPACPAPCAPAPCCGTAAYRPAYGYGVAFSSPHWF